MNIHLPAILMWTEGVQGFDTLPCQYCWAKIIQLQSVFPRSGRLSELFQPFPQWCRTRRRFKISYSMILSIALVVVATLALLVAGHWTSLHLQNTGQNTWFMSLWLMLIMLAQPHSIAIILQSYCHHIAIILPSYCHTPKFIFPHNPRWSHKAMDPVVPWRPQVGWQRYHQVKQLGMLRARRGLERKTGHRMVVACGRYIWKWSNLHI